MRGRGRRPSAVGGRGGPRPTVFAEPQDAKPHQDPGSPSPSPSSSPAPSPSSLRALVARARAVRQHAHAPYSRFSVGAAVLDESGRIHVGCNVENASYGLTVCAERNAVAAAVAAGAKTITAVAVATRLTDPPASPCGACRQVLAELAGDDAPVLLAGPTGAPRAERLGALLPLAFRLR